MTYMRLLTLGARAGKDKRARPPGKAPPPSRHSPINVVYCTGLLVFVPSSGDGVRCRYVGIERSSFGWGARYDFMRSARFSICSLSQAWYYCRHNLINGDVLE